MKKITTFLLAQCLCIICLGQSWAPSGAVWHYEQTDFNGPRYANLITIESIGDTMIAGETIQKLEKSILHINYFTGDSSVWVSTFYTKLLNDQVLYTPDLNESFELLYDFSADSGDVVTVYLHQAESDPYLAVRIDSVTTITIQGETRKVQHISSDPTALWSMSGEIIEGIGCTGYMFPQDVIVDPPEGGPLRCYEDNTLGLYRHTTDVACGYVTSLGDDIETASINLYPNPTSGTLHITVPEGVEDVALFDRFGKCVYKSKPVTSLDLSTYHDGLYVLVMTKENERYSRKVIKLGAAE